MFGVFGPLIFLYVFVPIAFVHMFKNYKVTAWIWLGSIVIGIFLGIAPFIAIAYLWTTRNSATDSNVPTQITYAADGSYTLYKTEEVKKAPSPGMLAFRIVGGVIAGVVVTFGLFVVGIILLFLVAPSAFCGGSSKCY